MYHIQVTEKVWWVGHARREASLLYVALDPAKLSHVAR
jgi:hypothetical protein